MKVLVACEYSGVVRNAFAKRGHDAYSCDILDSLDNSGKHFKQDVIELLHPKYNWDLIIAHPPCTYLCSSGARWYYHPEDKHLPVSQRRPHPLYPNRKEDKRQAADFFLKFAHYANVNNVKMCIENPIGVMSKWQKPTQIIQPYHFGDKVSKATCLWLWNLPALVPTNMVEPETAVTSGGKKHCPWFSNNKKLRSVTFQGIANAMAEQWG